MYGTVHTMFMRNSSRAQSASCACHALMISPDVREKGSIIFLVMQCSVVAMLRAWVFGK
uniref:Uncharacterized protein n=1 Tax=Arundo donax TaxID=35708 RepID=A0A0A9F111_ARUDO